MLRCVVLFVFGLPCLSFAVACCLICVCVGGLLARLGWCWAVHGCAWLGVGWGGQVGGSSAIGSKQFDTCKCQFLEVRVGLFEPTQNLVR